MLTPDVGTGMLCQSLTSETALSNFVFRVDSLPRTLILKKKHIYNKVELLEQKGVFAISMYNARWFKYDRD